MRYQQATGKTIQESFEAFHKAHPAVYEYFKKYVRQIVDKQKAKHIPFVNVRTSSKLILNRIRWEISIGALDPRYVHEINTKKQDSVEWSVLNDTYEDFKINDAFTSRYVRLFMDDFPTWSHIFNTRELRAA